MRLRPHEAAMACLEEDPSEGIEKAFPFSRESAVEFLQLFTSQDFGDNPTVWREWFRQYGTSEYIDACYAKLQNLSRNTSEGDTRT